MITNQHIGRQHDPAGPGCTAAALLRCYHWSAVYNCCSTEVFFFLWFFPSCVGACLPFPSLSLPVPPLFFWSEKITNSARRYHIDILVHSRWNTLYRYSRTSRAVYRCVSIVNPESQQRVHICMHISVCTGGGSQDLTFSSPSSSSSFCHPRSLPYR